jgi:hypothetical protein
MCRKTSGHRVKSSDGLAPMSFSRWRWRIVYPDFTTSIAAVTNGGFCLPAGWTLK